MEALEQLVIAVQQFRSVGQQPVGGCLSGIIMLETSLPWWVVWPVSILAGLLMGTLNGLLASKLKLFPLVVTIATSEVFKGIAYTMTSSKSYSGMPAAFRALYKTKLLGLPLDVYLALLIVVAAWLVLNKTHFGRDVLAVGGNKECARLSGIKADLIQTLCFAVTGAIFAIATLDMLAIAFDALKNRPKAAVRVRKETGKAGAA